MHSTAWRPYSGQLGTALHEFPDSGDARGRRRSRASPTAVRRLPVVDDNKRLSGMITEADIARHMPQETTGEMVGAIAAAHPQHF